MKTVAVNKVISENYEMLHILCLQYVILHSMKFYTGCGILHFFALRCLLRIYAFRV